jgi:cytochrome P450
MRGYTHDADTYDRKLTDSDLRDIILNFVIAGRDTTAQVCIDSALAWPLVYLLLFIAGTELGLLQVVHQS